MWGAGFAAGIGVGFGMGLVVGRLGATGRPWSELSEKEKKIRLGLIALLSVLVITGIVFLVVLL